MRALGLMLALAGASCLAAPGRLSNDQQTRDAVDEFARWRDSRTPGVQQDVGQETEDLRQQFEDIEQHFAEMGQQLESMGRQVDDETGQRTLDLGQQLEDVRQLVLAPSTPLPVQVSRVSLSEEDVGQVVDTPSSTHRPRPSTTVPPKANPVQMQRVSSSPRTPTVHQIVQESTAFGQQPEQVVVPANLLKVTPKPSVRGDQISVSDEVVDAGQQLEKLSIPSVQPQASPAPVQQLTREVSVSGEDQQQVSQTTCEGGILIGSVCYQSWDSDEEQGVRSTTKPSPPTTQRPVTTTPTQRAATTTSPARTTPTRLTAPVARAMSGARTTTTVRPETTTSEKTPARLSVSEEEIDAGTPTQLVQQRPQQMRSKPKVIGQVDNSSEEDTQVTEDLGQRPVQIGQRPEALQQHTSSVPHRPQRPRVVGQVENSSEEEGKATGGMGQRPETVQQHSSSVPHRPQKPKVVGQVDNSSEEDVQQPQSLGQRPQTVQQPAGYTRQSSEETGQIIYKPDDTEQRPERITQVSDSSEEVGQAYQRPETINQQPRATPSRPVPTTTVRPAVPKRVGQLQDPDVEGSEELGRIASYIRDKVNQEQDEDYDAGQQTVQTDWQSLRQLAQQVDVRAGQQHGVKG